MVTWKLNDIINMLYNFFKPYFDYLIIFASRKS